MKSLTRRQFILYQVAISLFAAFTAAYLDIGGSARPLQIARATPPGFW